MLEFALSKFFLSFNSFNILPFFSKEMSGTKYLTFIVSLCYNFVAYIHICHVVKFNIQCVEVTFSFPTVHTLRILENLCPSPSPSFFEVQSQREIIIWKNEYKCRFYNELWCYKGNEVFTHSVNFFYNNFHQKVTSL